VDKDSDIRENNENKAEENNEKIVVKPVKYNTETEISRKSRKRNYY